MKKKIAGLLVATTLVASLAGCGATDEPKKESGKQTSETGEEEISGELNLALFQGGLGAEYWEELIAKFEEKYPEVTVKYELNPKIGEIIRPRIIAGDSPDLIYHNQGQEDGLITGLIKDKGLMDISDVFEEMALEQDVKLKDMIIPGVLDSVFMSPYGDGKIYLAPFNISPVGMIYNKTLFEEKGWKVPTTWDEFFELGDIAKEEGRALLTLPGIYAGYFESMMFPAMANAAGFDTLKSFFNFEEESLENEEIQQVFKNIEKLATGGYILDGSTGMNHTQSQTEMMLGKALFIPNGVWIENEMKDAPREGDEKFEFGMLSGLKLNEDDSNYVQASVEQLSIPKDAKNPEAAKEFIKFIYTEESVKLFGEKAQGTLAVKNAPELVKEYITPGAYNMLKVLDDETITVFSDYYATLPENSKINISTEVMEKGLIPVLNQEMTAEEWIEKTQNDFAEIRENMETTK